MTLRQQSCSNLDQARLIVRFLSHGIDTCPSISAKGEWMPRIFHLPPSQYCPPNKVESPDDQNGGPRSRNSRAWYTRQVLDLSAKREIPLSSVERVVELPFPSSPPPHPAKDDKLIRRRHSHILHDIQCRVCILLPH